MLVNRNGSRELGKGDRKDERRTFKVWVSTLERKESFKHVRLTGKMKDMNIKVRLSTLERKESVMHVRKTGRMKGMVSK